jgi:drug/metabolite transporter (DMT)-like permease
LAGAVTWGLVWYPYRLLEQGGISGATGTFITYLLPLLAGLVLFRRDVAKLHHTPILYLLALSAGWTNLGYVLAIIHGEVMQVLLLFYLAPLWTVLFARLLLGERPGLFGYLVMALSFAGALVMLWRPGMAPLPETAAEWAGLTAGMMFALSNVLARKAERLTVPQKSLSIWAGVSLVSGLALLVSPPALPAMGQIDWPLLLFVAFVMFAVTLAVQYGLAKTPANQAIVIFLSELVVAAASSYWLAGEVMNVQEWVGGAMIVAATLFSGKLEEKTV